MCTEISPSLMLGISLRHKRCVCAERLQKKRRELMTSNCDLLADVSYSSIRQAVGVHAETMSLRLTMGTFGICKKKSSPNSKDRIFDSRYVRESLAICLDEKEFSIIERVMLAK